MNAREYLSASHRSPVRCGIQVRPVKWADEGFVLGDAWAACGLPAVGVYVSDDDSRRATYTCAAHSLQAEQDGDGPAFKAGA